ncbi:hypothetical protein QCA50_016976 [Cerrena zonata]|uniref:Uncharacterized protein n=1 Tax=Cerrena zonata TaxID=2478898 RepID=A0AAW0FLY7_9APHY
MGRTKATPTTEGVKRKVFNLVTAKYHALGDYLRQIITFGTTDSYSTQPGELEHRNVKRYYARSNKIRATAQMANIHRRERILQKTIKRLKNLRTKIADRRHREAANVISSHHFISDSRNNPVYIDSWLESFPGDPALKDYFGKLHNHLLGRLRNPGQADNGVEYGPVEHGEITILNDRLFEHKTLRVHYTTYDLQRNYDLINPSKYADIMAVAHDVDVDAGISEGGHPFVYARVLGIYHTDIFHMPREGKPIIHSMEFLFVRWYRRDETFKAGFQQKRLHRLSFIPASEPNAFGFLDPDDVVRAAHLMPVFASGRTDEYLPGKTVSRPLGEEDDWKHMYVNCFVDRDMYMCYRGGGIGHVRLKVDDPVNEEEWSDEEDFADTEDELNRGGDAELDERSESESESSADGSDIDDDSSSSEGEELDDTRAIGRIETGLGYGSL